MLLDRWRYENLYYIILTTLGIIDNNFFPSMYPISSFNSSWLMTWTARTCWYHINDGESVHCVSLADSLLYSWYFIQEIINWCFVKNVSTDEDLFAFVFRLRWHGGGLMAALWRCDYAIITRRKNKRSSTLQWSCPQTSAQNTLEILKGGGTCLHLWTWRNPTQQLCPK